MTMDANDRETIAITRLARACYGAQWDEPFPREGTIDHALALQVGRAAYDEMRQMTSEFVLGDQ